MLAIIGGAIAAGLGVLALIGLTMVVLSKLNDMIESVEVDHTADFDQWENELANS